MSGEDREADWRDPAAYAPLLAADRSLIAWEWLRRDPAYRVDAGQSLRTGVAGSPARWGLHAFVPPDLGVPAARPVWTAGADPFVLAVEAGPPRGDDLFQLDRFEPMATLVGGDRSEHLLLCDGSRTIRVDVLAGSIAGGPAELRYRIAGLKSAERPVLALRRLIALCRTGVLSRSLHPPEVRAARWVLELRARDALAAGAGQREIAAVLLGGEASRPNWRVLSPSLRSRVQRLVRSARAMGGGGYRALLLGPHATPAAFPGGDADDGGRR